MKKLGKAFILIAILLIIYGNRNAILTIIVKTVSKQETITLDYKNEYYLSYNYKYVKNLSDINSIQNKNDLLNLYYTVINSGNSDFTFYCPSSYKSCVSDVKALANDQKELSNINGFVHPFNSFDTIETMPYSAIGKVDLKIIKTYTDVEIEEIGKKVEEVVKTEVKDETDERQIIKIIHDYIINNSKYDKLRADNNVIKYSSNTAYGVLFEGYGICSGYADAMALFLDYYKIPNYKIASENHVWNAVFLDGKWYHLDLTWDDPMLESGEDVIIYDYFLITTEKLKELDNLQHNFDTKIYPEMA